jgi:cysteine synthase A
MRKIERLIGKTPIIRLCGIEKYLGIKARIFAKLEKYNPTGSVKDRPALFMLNDAERRGLRGRGIVEATSGNLGISLAFLCAVRGYKLAVVMPKSASVARRKMISSLGAELILTDGGMDQARGVAEEMQGYGNHFCLSQFDNSKNPLAHRMTTGPEIYSALRGRVDIFVSGVGSGGTISGVGSYLKAKNPLIRVVAVEPKESAILSGGKPSSHRIEGIGAGFLPTILDKNVINQVISVSFEESMEGVKMLAEREGLLLGISSGATLYAALSVVGENEGKNIVLLMPDGIEKYLLT